MRSEFDIEEEGKRKIRADVVVEFLEVAFHSILYHRSVYPRAVFCLRKKYQVPVHVSKHPEINEYLTECLKTGKWLLENDGLKQITLVIVDGDEEVLEKYCFDVDVENGSGTMDEHFVEAEETFREYLLKLSVIGGEEDKTEMPGKSFRIEMTTREQCSVRMNEDPERIHFPWIESDSGRSDDYSLNHFRIFPLKTLETSGLKLNMYAEK